jgi:hypothetical protein
VLLISVTFLFHKSYIRWTPIIILEGITVGAIKTAAKIIGISAGVYLGACVLQTQEVTRELDRLRADFRNTAVELPSGLETRMRNGSEYRALDYSGRLDEKIQKRNQYLKERGCIIYSGRWYVTKTVADPQAGKQNVTINDKILCYKPFPL